MASFIKAVTLLISIICILIADSNLCQSSTSLPITIQSHQTAYDSTSHALYVFGGIDLADTYRNFIWKWDIHSNVWTPTGITPKNTFYSFVNNAVTIQDIVYFIGVDDGYYTSGNVYRFRFTTEDWLPPTDINKATHPSIRGCLTHNTTHIFMVGGQTGSNTYTDQLQTYKVSSNVWTTETINVSPIYGQGLVGAYCQSIATDLYLFGGGTTESFSDVIGNIFKYNSADKWTSIGQLPEVQGWGFSVYNQRSSAIYLVGGYARGGVKAYVNTILVFDVATESIRDTWLMKHERAYSPANIINGDLYVFGGQHARSIALSSIEVCAIPQLVTMDPTTNPSTVPIHNPSVSPTNNPSKYPTNYPSTAPIRNPSVSPAKQRTSPPTNHPSHPRLRADVPSSLKSISTTYETDESPSPGAKYSTESPEDMIRKSSVSVTMTMLWVIGSSVLTVCIVVVATFHIYRMIKKRKVDVVHQVERMTSTSQTPGKVYALECDDANNMDNGDEPSEAEGVHEDVNQLVTPTGGPPNIAPDEFVVVGDDGDTTQGFGNNCLDEVVAVGEGSGSCGIKY
eukprot:421485_1